MLTVCGRVFTADELEGIREITGHEPALTREGIAREVCDRLSWRTPAGRPKVMSCKVALLRLDAQGLITLPAPRHRQGQWNGHGSRPTIVVPAAPVAEEALSFGDIKIRPVAGRKASRLWNEAVARFHYLGYVALPGAQIRYLVERGAEILGVLGFGASAWKVAPRDTWIGWTERERRERLRFVVNNSRFLILPWVRKKNLASWVLSRCARRLGQDFEDRYAYRPVLLETFVEKGRFSGTCYRAANWTCVGETQGRGKLDRQKRFGLPVKRIYMYPLAPDFREVLCG